MGSALLVVLERDIPGLDTSEPVRALGAMEPRLRPLCRELGVPPLSSFLSDDPDRVSELYDQDRYRPGEPTPDLTTLSPERWFPADDGLATVRALLDRLDQHPELLRGSSHVAEDLKRLEEILAEAEVLEIGWHLAGEEW